MYELQSKFGCSLGQHLNLLFTILLVLGRAALVNILLAEFQQPVYGPGQPVGHGLNRFGRTQFCA